jgi:hypothetical protein
MQSERIGEFVTVHNNVTPLDVAKFTYFNPVSHRNQSTYAHETEIECHATETDLVSKLIIIYLSNTNIMGIQNAVTGAILAPSNKKGVDICIITNLRKLCEYL